MPRLGLACASGVVAALMVMAGCSQTPAAPSGATDGGSVAARPPGTGPVQPPEGRLYEVTFLQTPGDIPVTSLPVSDPSMRIRVHVEDASGQPAESGFVLYEMCMTGGRNGTARPSADCANGLARWTRWIDAEIIPGGNTYAGIDIVHNPCTIGFRMTFHGSKTIASKQLGPFDFSWTE